MICPMQLLFLFGNNLIFVVIFIVNSCIFVVITTGNAWIFHLMIIIIQIYLNAFNKLNACLV